MPALLDPLLDQRYALSIGQRVDAKQGVVYEATVAKAGVRAIGKYVMLDAEGQLTIDPDKAAKKLPVMTDAKTLETLMQAAVKAGGRAKIREDHDDSIGARAGVAEGFKLEGDRVSVDLYIFDNYRNRGVFLETAEKTPDKVGLSIDMIPSFEISGGVALMRIRELLAVDIVDAGAITPDGLLLDAGPVDNAHLRTEPSQVSPQPSKDMAAPTLEELMTAVQKMTDGYTALAGQVKSCMEAIAEHGKTLSKLATPPKHAEPDGDEPDGDDGDGEPDGDELKAQLKELSTKLAAVTGQVATMRKEKILLGINVTDAEKLKLAAGTVEEIETVASKDKTYLQLVDDCVATEKCARADAHSRMQHQHPEKYQLHLKAKGIVRVA